MSLYYPYGNCGSSGTVPPYACSPCSNKEYARARSVFFYKTSSPFLDITSPTEWSTKITAGNAIVLWKVTGALTNITTEQLAGYGDTEFENGQTSYEMVFNDPNVVENGDFYDAMPLTTEYNFGFKTSSRIWDIGVPCTVSRKLVVSNNLKDIVTYEVTVKWVSNSSPTNHAIPAGIFTQCYTTT